MSAQWKWVIGIVSVVAIFALLACGIFLGWRYLFPEKPSVVIDAPPSNYQAVEGDEVIVAARASGRSIVRIELWVDDGLMDSASSPSPQDVFSAALTWEATGLGRHIVEVKAYSLAGRGSDPAGVIIIVVPRVAEATPTPTTPPPTPTPTSPPEATPTPTSLPPTATATSPPEATPTPTSPPPTATPTLAPPVIDSFTLDDTTITAGETTYLRWEFHNATESHLYRDDVEIQSGLPSSGNRPVNPAVTRTFKLVVRNAAGSAEHSVTLTVTPAGPPVIHYFKVNGVEGDITITEGESVTLKWDTDNAWGGVFLNGAGVVSPGETAETPGVGAHTYTLVADNGAGVQVSLSRTVTVNPAAPTVHSEGWETIEGTRTFDLDEGVVTPAAGDRDFHWSLQNAALHERSLVPWNGATYSIRGPQAWGDVDYAECNGATYSGATITANMSGPNYMPGTTVICFKTNVGRMGKFRVEGYVGANSNDLYIRWVTWE